MTKHRLGKLAGKRRTPARPRSIELLEPRTLLAYVPASLGVVNNHLPGFQGAPSVAIRQDQRFTVAWQDNDYDGSHSGIYARRYQSTGEPDGNEFRVNNATQDSQAWPFVATNDTGTTVVAWKSVSNATIQFQRFAPDGTKLGENVSVPDSQAATEMGVIVEPDGSFFVCWNSWEFIIQRYDSAGVLSDRIQTPLVQSSWFPNIIPRRVARFGNELLIPFGEWNSAVIPGVGEQFHGRGVIRRVPLDGSAYSDEVLVDFTGPERGWLDVIFPDVLPLQDGTLLATWTGGGQSFISAERFDGKFQPIGGEFTLSGIESATNNAFVRTAQLTNGDIVATWPSGEPFGDVRSLFGVYGVDGTPHSEPTLIAAANASVIGSLEVIPRGDAFTLVWEGSQEHFGSYTDVQIQNFKKIIPSAQVEFGDASVAVSETEIQFPLMVVRGGTLDVPVRAHIKTVDDSAHANVDYTPIDEDVVIQAGESEKYLTVSINDNSVLDGTRVFRVVISSVSGEGASVGTIGETVVRIDDDEVPEIPGTISMERADYVVAEGDDYVRITMTRTEGATGEVSVLVRTDGGSATAGSDYETVNTTVTWDDGDAEPKTILIGIGDDSTAEANESFVVSISNPTGGALLGGKKMSNVTISDDDPVTPPPPPLVRLASIAPKFRRGVLNSVAISFNGTPDPSQRMKPNAIVLVRAGRDRKIGTADDLVTRFRGVRVSSAIHGVILTPPPGLTLKGNYHVRVDGSLIKDLNGSRLDADNDGISGGRRYVKLTKRAWTESV